MKKATKLMSLLLALVLLVGLMSAAAYAAEAEEPAPSDKIRETATELAKKFAEDPEGSIRKVKKAAMLVDIGEDVLSVVYHIDRMKDTAEDAKFEADALRAKIEYNIGNIGKPDDPIADAQCEIDQFVAREQHEKDQINEDIDNINKLGKFLGEKTGKDIPEIPAFDFGPFPLVLAPKG